MILLLILSFPFILKPPRHPSICSLLAVTSLTHWENSSEQSFYHPSIFPPAHTCAQYTQPSSLLLKISNVLWSKANPPSCVLDSIPSFWLGSLLKYYYQWVLHWQPSLKFHSLWYSLFPSHDIYFSPYHLPPSHIVYIVIIYYMYHLTSPL